MAAVLLASFAVFLIPYVTPGDPVRKIIRSRVAGDVVDDSAVKALSCKPGPQRSPVPIAVPALARATSSAATWACPTPAAHRWRTRCCPRSGITLSLVVLALGTRPPVSVPLGIMAALQEGGTADKVITAVTQAFIAMPEYWLAPLLVLVFALKLSAAALGRVETARLGGAARGRPGPAAHQLLHLGRARGRDRRR